MSKQTPWEEFQVPGVVPLLQRIAQGQDRLAQAVEQMAAGQQALAASIGAVNPTTPSVTTAPAPVAMVRLPLTVNDILRSAVESGDTGNLAVYDNDYIITVGAGATVVQIFPTYSRPTAIIGDLTASASAYDASGLLTVQIFVDGNPVAGPSATSAVPLTGPKVVSFSQYSIAQTEVQVVVTNLTAGNVDCNFQGVQVSMSAEFFKQHFAPLLKRFGFAGLSSLASD